MRQSRFTWFGAAVVAVPLAFAAVFGWRAAVERPAMPATLVGGLLTVLSGRVAAVELGDVRVSWRYILAAGYALMAIAFPLSQHAATNATSTDGYVPLGAAAVTACCLLLFAIEIARDGPHVDVTPDVERVLAR